MQNDNPLSQKEALEIIFNLEKTVEKLATENQRIPELEQKLAQLKMQYDEVKARLEQLLHERYGKKSEKLKSEEHPIADEPVVTPEEAAEIEAAEQEITVTSHTRKKPKRKPLPAEFPREIVVYALPPEEQICQCCNGPLQIIGEDVSEKIEYIPAQIKVIRTVRKKYGCQKCEIGVKIAPLPATLLPKALAAPGLLSHVILSKYEDHLPLYRQERIWQRLGVDIPRATLCSWVLSAAEALSPLIPLLRQEIIQTGYARSDETPVQVMEENKVRLSKKAYMWVFTTGRTEKAVIVYHFAMSREGATATTFFEGFKGHLQTDGYGGYNQLTSIEGVTQVCCWAHARRKFMPIVKSAKKPGAARYAVSVIDKLYRIEKAIKEANLNVEETKTRRQEQAKPIMDGLKTWLLEKAALSPPKSPLGKAINYTLERWKQLTQYLDYGFLDIDNNFAERAVRPFTIGRKNWMFMGNERGGAAAAVLYSLIETAKANGLNTYAYFRYLITKFPLRDPDDQTALSALLPSRLTPEDIDPYLK